MFPLVNKTVQRQCKETHGLHPSFRLKKRLGDLDCWRIFFPGRINVLVVFRSEGIVSI